MRALLPLALPHLRAPARRRTPWRALLLAFVVAFGERATFTFTQAEAYLVTLADDGGALALLAPALDPPLAPGETRTTRVTFAAGGLGLRAGLVRVESSDAASPAAVQLRGKGALPELVVASTLDFPLTRVPREALLPIIIDNASPDLPLRVTEATVTGAGFRRATVFGPGAPGEVVVAPGGQATLALGFAPPDEGPFTGQLALRTDDPRRDPALVTLSGEGTWGALELTLLPGPAPGETTVQAGSFQALRLRAVEPSGLTDESFTGLVEVRVSDPLSPLDRLTAFFLEEDHGAFTSDYVPAFLTPGAHTLTARLLLPDGRAEGLGTAAVTVGPGPRGRAYAVLPARSGELGPGAVVEARLFVDCGANDGDPHALGDTLGAYDVRLVVDPLALDVVEVLGGPVLGAPSFRWLGSGVRLMRLPDTGSLTFPQGPNPAATGLALLATVRLRVRESAPAGRTPVLLAVDALATAEGADTPLGPPVGAHARNRALGTRTWTDRPA